MKAVKLVLTAVVLLLVLLLGIYNHQLVQLTLFSHQSLPIPLFLLLLLSFACGFLAASLWDTVKISRLRRQLRKEQGRCDTSPPPGGSEFPDSNRGEGPTDNPGN